jgi:hypothetical protein
MKVYDQLDKEGRISAFEISALLGRRRLCKLVRSIPEARIIKAPGFRSFFKGEDEFCEFEIHGQKFKAWEPYNDNSRYWIGSDPPHWCEQLETIRSAFLQHKLFGLF